MACPHWFPKQDTLYPETGDFVAENGIKVAFFRMQSRPILFRKQVWREALRHNGRPRSLNLFDVMLE